MINAKGQTSNIRQNAEGRRLKKEDRIQKTKDKIQKTEDEVDGDGEGKGRR